MHDLKILSGRSNQALSREIADYLGVPLGKISLGNFPDGEISCKMDEDVRGRDVFLIQPTCPPVNDNLMELLIMIDSCLRASAERITAVIPYFGYARQDRKDEGRVPITAKLVANLITRAGADRVLTMDLHAAADPGVLRRAGRSPLRRAGAERLLPRTRTSTWTRWSSSVPTRGASSGRWATPSGWGAPWRSSTSVGSAPTKTVQANILGGPIEGKVALMFDDMISTAGSINGAAKVLHDHGVKEIHVATSHAVLCGAAMDNLREADLASLVCTNSIPLRDDQKLPQTKILSVAPLLGEAIKAIHRNESISKLFR